MKVKECSLYCLLRTGGIQLTALSGHLNTETVSEGLCSEGPGTNVDPLFGRGRFICRQTDIGGRSRRAPDASSVVDSLRSCHYPEIGTTTTNEVTNLVKIQASPDQVS